MVSAFVNLPSDFEKFQNGLFFQWIEYIVRQGPNLVPIQTTDVVKEIMKDKNALLFNMELRVSHPIFEIGGLYVTPKSLFRFWKYAKEVVEWVLTPCKTRDTRRMDMFLRVTTPESTLHVALSKGFESGRTASRRTDLLSSATATDEIACQVA